MSSRKAKSASALSPDMSPDMAPDTSPGLSDIEAAVRALADAHPPTKAQLDHEDAVADRARHKRMLEALLFAAEAPLDVEFLRRRMPEGAEVVALLAQLEAEYQDRGVQLKRVAGKWRMQTPADLAPLLREERAAPRKLSQAALETLAIIAYHQPATRAEVEAVRGVAVSKGTLDTLLEMGWVRPRGRRRAPGRPLVYVTTDAFLEHFGLESLESLPGKAELKAAGLLDETAPDDFEVPDPTLAGLQDELPLEEPEDGDEGEFQADFMSEDDDETADEASGEVDEADEADEPDEAGEASGGDPSA